MTSQRDLRPASSPLTLYALLGGAALAVLVAIVAAFALTHAESARPQPKESPPAGSVDFVDIETLPSFASASAAPLSAPTTAPRK